MPDAESTRRAREARKATLQAREEELANAVGRGTLLCYLCIPWRTQTSEGKAEPTVRKEACWQMFSARVSWHRGLPLPPNSTHVAGPREAAVCTETCGAARETEPVKLTLEIRALQMVMHM